MDANAVIIVSKIFASICIIEAVSGLVFNLLVLIIILSSRRLRSTSTFKILAVSAINDIVVSIPWNQEDFFSTMFNYSASYSSLFYCRWIANFSEYTTLSIESWIVLSISVDRLLSLTVKKWSKFYFSGYRPYIFAVLLCFIITALNFHLGFTAGYSIFDNETQTETIICYVTDPAIGYDWYGFAAKVSVIVSHLSVKRLA